MPKMSRNLMCFADPPVSNSTRQLLTIEKIFDHCRTFTWLEHNWQLSYYLIAAYVVALFAGKAYMKGRPPFKVQKCLFTWNLGLALFSILASWRLVPAMVTDIREHGFFASVCTHPTDQHMKAISLWMWLYILSKVVEFGDTAFIILRKAPLSFLHWYHHLSVTFFSWCSAGAHMSMINLYFGIINSLVHSIMYSYYTLTALKIRVPEVVRMAITSLQLFQMVFGMFLTGYIYSQKAAGRTCMVQDQVLTMAACIYSSYFVLFANFFFRTYIGKKPRVNGAMAKGKKWN